jgi:hypothetical protein
LPQHFCLIHAENLTWPLKFKWPYAVDTKICYLA